MAYAVTGQAMRLAHSTGLANCLNRRVDDVAGVRAQRLADPDLTSAPLGDGCCKAEQAEAGEQHGDAREHPEQLPTRNIAT